MKPGRPSNGVSIPSDRTPPATDRRWGGWARPVYDFLEEPRTWADLDAWGAAHQFALGHMVQCLAWLEIHGYVFAGVVAPVVWRRTGKVWR